MLLAAVLWLFFFFSVLSLTREWLVRTDENKAQSNQVSFSAKTVSRE